MSTGNTDRIRTELEKAVERLPERVSGYRDALVRAAMECITDTAEHDDRRVNINQRFDARIQRIAAEIGKARAGDSSR
jgi:hypothetical protein